MVADPLFESLAVGSTSEASAPAGQEPGHQEAGRLLAAAFGARPRSPVCFGPQKTQSFKCLRVIRPDLWLRYRLGRGSVAVLRVGVIRRCGPVCLCLMSRHPQAQVGIPPLGRGSRLASSRGRRRAPSGTRTPSVRQHVFGPVFSSWLFLGLAHDMLLYYAHDL